MPITQIQVVIVFNILAMVTIGREKKEEEKTVKVWNDMENGHAVRCGSECRSDERRKKKTNLNEHVKKEVWSRKEKGHPIVVG